MAFTFNGTTQYLNATSVPVTASPLTIACWGLRTTLTSVGNATFVALTDQASSGSNFALRHSTGTNAVQATVQYDGGSTYSALTTKNMTANTAHHLCGVFTSSTSRTAYIDGGNSGSETTNITPKTPSRVLIGAGWYGSISQYVNGWIAEVGIWNVALTADEVASLAKGFTPSKVRPQSLVFYAPLVRNLVDTERAIAITNNNSATVSAHPRVYA